MSATINERSLNISPICDRSLFSVGLLQLQIGIAVEVGSLYKFLSINLTSTVYQADARCIFYYSQSFFMNTQ